ncbi:MAG: AMP-binding protein, partial [Gammaproteobacteria bacterium]
MNLISAFFDRCDAAPDQAAFVQDGRRIGYDQFRRRAIQIGSVLYSRVESSGRVAVALERGIDAAAAIYGIAAFGGCYVPLDVKNPAERLRFIVADADPGIVIGRGQCPAWVNDRDKWLDIDAVA